MIHRLTKTIFVQEGSAGDPSDAVGWSMLTPLPLARPVKISHVVNPYRVTGPIGRVQELTARSMTHAAAFARDVKLLAVVLREERDLIPPSFKAAPYLRRTVADVRNFALPRPFPLLFDILANGAAAAKSDSYLIFTNSDICLVPNFYCAVRSLLAWGLDCLIINRRTVAPLENYGTLPELAALEVGGAHPGFDCFVFPAAWVSDFIPNNACVGVGYVMRSLLFNLVVKARRMLILRDAHLTYHYGDDRLWDTPDFREYMEHNVTEARAVLEGLSTDLARYAALAEFCAAHGESFPDGPCFRPSIISG